MDNAQLTLSDVKKARNELAETIRAALQKFHEETGLRPDVDIDYAESFGDPHYIFLVEIAVIA
jgi:hypothetical protein